MLKKYNLFFKKLESFNKRKAIILNTKKFYTYEQLCGESKKIFNILENGKKLIFILAKNNIETLVGYISFVNKGYAVVLLDYRLNETLLQKLIKIYKPNYIFLEKSSKKINYYNHKLSYRNFVLLKRSVDEYIKINNSLMLLMSTSGTTGSPKFVRLSYKNVISNTQRIIQYLNIKKSDITITSLPISYVYGLSVITTHLFAGSTIVLTNRSMIEKDFWQLVRTNKVSNFSGVPYNYSIIEKILNQKFPKSIKYSTQAGGKMNNILLKKIIKIYKKNKVKLIQMYGAAEATSRMSYLRWEKAEKKIGSIGKPIPGGKIYLIKRNGNKIYQKYKKGELVYEGENVFMGYAQNLNDLSLPDLCNGKLKTGDIAYQDKEGYFYITGRKNRYVKIFGIRLNLSELETMLLEKGYEAIMKEGKENKINIFLKRPKEADKIIQYISKITSISHSVFIIKKINKKNLTSNFKLKL